MGCLQLYTHGDLVCNNNVPHVLNITYVDTAVFGVSFNRWTEISDISLDVL